MADERRRFLRLNLGIVATAVLFGATVGVLLAASPATPPTPLSRVYRPGSRMPPPSERKAALDRGRVVSSSFAARLLTGPESARNLEQAAKSFDAAWRAQIEPTKEERSFASAIDLTYDTISGTSIVSFGLCGLLGVSGLIGLSRLKVRGMTILSSSLLALAAGAGGAVLALLDANRLCVALITLLCIAGLFGQLITTNLLPDSNHPFVVRAESDLRALPPERRRRYLMVRLAGGFGMSAIGVLGTLASMFLVDGPIFTVFTGAFASGLLVAVLPLIATIRLRGRDGENGTSVSV